MEAVAREVKLCPRHGIPRTGTRTDNRTGKNYPVCVRCRSGWNMASAERMDPTGEKRRERSKRSQRKHHRRYLLKYEHGMTVAEYDEMFVAQKGLCRACGGPPDRKSLCVDHSHKTGEIRGLLCAKCNVALGYVEEDIVRLKGLIQYITGWKPSKEK